VFSNSSAHFRSLLNGPQSWTRDASADQCGQETRGRDPPSNFRSPIFWEADVLRIQEGQKINKMMLQGNQSGPRRR
jgi:hypothetical protein